MVSPFCIIDEKINPINLLCVFLRVTLNAKMSFGTDTCMETFATLLKFLMAMN